MKNHISSVIKSIRIARGLTQEQLAELVGKSPAYIGMLEQGRAKPSYDVMEKIINEFDVDANLFFSNEGSAPKRICADILLTIQNMPPDMQEHLKLFNYVINQFAKEVYHSDEDSDM